MKAQIEKLIAEGKIEKAISLLLAYTKQLPDDDLYKEVTHHSAVFARIDKNQRLGTESTADQNIAYARINQSLIGVLKKLPDSDSPSLWSRTKAKNNNLLKTILIVLGVLALLALLYFFLMPKSIVYTCGSRECPQCIDCYNSGCFEEAERCFNALKKQNADEQAKAQASRAILDADDFMNQGLFDKALAFYLKAIDLDQGVEVHRKKAIEGIQLIIQANNSLSENKLAVAKESYAEAREKFESMNRSDSDGGIFANPDYNRISTENVEDFIHKKLETIKELEEEDGLQKGKLPAILKGKWTQSKSGKEGEIKGDIQFKEADGLFIANYQNRFANGIVHTGELLDLSYSTETQILQGTWHNFDTKQKGAFSFKVDEPNKKLSGKYSLDKTSKPSYYWNGYK